MGAGNGSVRFLLPYLDFTERNGKNCRESIHGLAGVQSVLDPELHKALTLCDRTVSLLHCSGRYEQRW